MSQGGVAGKKIWVTGGSRGIGAAIVRLLAQEGAQVAFTFTSQRDLAENLLKTLPGSGHVALEMNVLQKTSMEECSTKVIEALGGLDGLVNNAGVTKDQLLLRMKWDDFDEVVRANLYGAFYCSKLALKALLKSPSGSIVNISSVIAQLGNPGQVNYAASKAGIEGFTRSLALELAGRGLRVNAIAPGMIQTDMTDKLSEAQKTQILERIPMKRMGESQDIAQGVLFLLDSASRYMTGQVLHINGGMFLN